MEDAKLPKGWCLASIADVSVKGGQRKPGQDETFNYIDIGSINRDSKRIESPQCLLGKTAPSRARKIVNTGDVLVSLTRPNLNAVAYVPAKYDGQIASTGFEVIKALLVDGRYIFALTRSKHFIDSISGVVQGALYPAAKSIDVQTYEFPLPPLAEQKVIADKLDTLLAQVKTTKARLERIPEILKTFRQSVLAAAVSGKLTEEWHGQEKSIDEVCVAGFDGPFGSKLKSSDYTESGVRVARLENIGHLTFDNHKITYVSIEKYSTIEKNTLDLGDILFSSFVDEEVKVCVFDIDDEVFINKADCFCLRPNQKLVNSKYLSYVLASRTSYAQIKEQVQGVTRPRVNLRILKGLCFDFPPVEQQAEVVRSVEELFAFADTIEQKANAALERVNNLTQSVLAKAFKGELTADWRAANPELISGENSAKALLEKIKAEREKLKPIKKAPRKKKSA